MKYFFSTAVLVAGALAMPTNIHGRDNIPIYDASNPVLDSVCPAPTSPPLTGLFPFANLLGSIVSPVLHALIGDEAVEDLESVFQ